MKIVVTGGAGFLGTLLARRLLSGPVRLAGAPDTDVSELLLLDLLPARSDLTDDPRVRSIVGELSASLASLPPVDAIVHLAGVVSGQAERDFDLGMRTNVDGTRAALEWARNTHRRPPVFVLTSSIAVFGNDHPSAPIETVDDRTIPTPQSSYGFQKFISEQLVADYARRGYVDGRSVRLMTVAVRPGAPNAAASSFLSGIIREPLAGERAVCPVSPDLPVALSSPSRTIDGIMTALQADPQDWGSRTAVNLPSLTTTPAEMLHALDRVTPGLSSLVEWKRDSAVERIVTTWPSHFETPRAAGLGLSGPRSFDEVIDEYRGGLG